MCSWCWGFRPTWEKIQSGIPADIEVRYLLGGLAPDSDEPMPEAMQRDIAGYWRKIQQHIPGTAFNFDFWEQCSPRRSTYPACRAVIAAKKQSPKIEKEMIKAIQAAYYLNAKNPSNDDVLVVIAKDLGLNDEKFKVDLNSDETQKELEKDIHFSQQIGARGFPSMILNKGNEYQSLPLNYNDPEPVLEFIKEQYTDFNL